MGDVLFYHLTRSPLDLVLARLLTRALAAEWRVIVRGRDRDHLLWLDEKLWLEPEDGFLPHGLAGGPHDAEQPVLLTEAAELPSDAGCLMTIYGAPVDPAEAGGLHRVCVLFDGNDDAAKALARQQWRDVTTAGLGAQYWAEDSGRWEKKLERPATTG